ncbi:MAG: AsmA family protein [Proteobacteria bacterium]|nr:AsmA family protein [Pseudomonadota bacterium]
MEDNETENTEIEELEHDSETKNKNSKANLLDRIILISLWLVLLAFIAPYFLNNSALKFQLTQKITQSLGTKLSIRGKVKVKILPHFAIIAKDVLVEDYKPKDSEKTYDLYAESVEFRLPIFNSSKDSSIKKLIFKDAILASYQGDKKLMQRDDNLTKIIANLAKNSAAEKESLKSGISAKLFSISDISAFSSANLPQIVIEDSEMIFYDKLARKREIKSINAEAKISPQNIDSEGSFVSQNILSDFKLSAVFNSKSGKKDSEFHIISPALELHIEGNFLSKNQGFLRSDFVGNIDAEIMELKSFYQSYINNDGVIATKLKYNAKPIKISAEINSAEQQISISNLKISSDLVDGNGKIDLSLVDDANSADILLELDMLDLDNIWSNEVVAANNNSALKEVKKNLEDVQQENAEQNSSDESQSKDSKINIEMSRKIKNLDLAAEIKVKKIKYLAAEVRDTDLYFTTSRQGDITIMPAIFNIPGAGVLRLSGVLDNSTVTSKFIGEFDVKGSSLKEVFRWLKIESQNLKLDALGQYSAHSNILLLPNSTSLNGLYLNLEGSEFSGEMKFDNDGKSINSSGRLHVNSFNIDDHFLISGQNTYFSPGLLIKKLFWLNDVSSSNSFDLSFDKLIYKKEEFGEQSFKLKLGRGYFEISDLKLQSPKTDLRADFAVDISDQNLRFRLKMDAEKFHYETPESEKNNENKINAFDQFFAMPSLEGFNGEIDLNIAEAQIDNVEINNAKLFGRIKDGNIENANFSGGFYGGKFSYQGVLGLKVTKIINGNLSFINADIKPFLSDLFDINNVSGVGNFAANITAIASNKNEFSKQLKSEIKFSVNLPSVEGYGLSDLIKKMFARENYKQELSNPEKILFNQEAKTIFKQATGAVQINNGKEGKVRISVAGPAVNAILSGNFGAEDKSVDFLFNAIFLTGSKEKQIPINIASNLKGKTADIKQSTNIDQARKYLGLEPLIKAQQSSTEKSTLITAP